MRLPISYVTMVLSCTVSEIRRLIAHFYPLDHSVPSLLMFPLEFRGEVNRQETRFMELSSSEDRMNVAGVVLT